MATIRLFLFLLFLFISPILNAQSFENTLLHLKVDFGSSIIKTSDNHLLISGGNYIGRDNRILIMKTNLFGNTEWLKTIKGDSCRLNAANVFESFDGNYVLSGSGIDTSTNGHYFIILIKVDTSCNVIWKKQYYSSSGTYEKVIQTRDSGFALLTSTYGPSPFTLTKLDKDGIILWSKMFSDGAVITSAEFDLIETPIGDLLISGLLFCPVSCDFKIKMKLDKDGNVIWTKNMSHGSDDLMAASGNYYYFKSQYTGQDCLIQLDTAGNIIWANSLFAQGIPFEINDIKGDHSNGVYFTGREFSSGEHAFIGHCDSTGVVDLFKIYTNNARQAFSDLYVGNISQLYMLGYTRSPGPDSTDLFYGYDDLTALNCSFITPQITTTPVPITISSYNPLAEQFITFNSIDDSLIVYPDTNYVIMDCLYLSTSENISNEIQIYPNPASNFVTVEFDDVSAHEISILNIYSQVLKKFKTTERTNIINIESLPSGIYYISFSANQKLILKTIVKM